MSNLENILSSFDLRDELSPQIWEKKEGKFTLNPKVREKLLKISNEFYESLDVDVIISDIIFTGSLANYNWSNFSDIDLHLVANFKQFDEKNLPLYEELFTLKKSLFNDKHDIKIYNYDVELYVQDENEEHASTGVYSVMKDEWLVEPNKKKEKIDKKLILSKSKQWMKIIDGVLENIDDETVEDAKELIKKYKTKLKKYRTCGLEKGGEYSVENLVFKVLRRNGYIEKLYNSSNKLLDKKLSLKETNMPKLEKHQKTDFIFSSVDDFLYFLDNINEVINQEENQKKEKKEVAAVQIALDILFRKKVGNYQLPRFGVDGKFGPETAKAIEEFKKDFKIEDSNIKESLDSKILRHLRMLINEEETEEQKFGSPLPIKLQYRASNGFRSKQRPNHQGIDFIASSGTDALAIANGIVIRTASDSGKCGGTIVIQHADGYTSAYCHMKRIDVKEQQSVQKGDIIGLTGGASSDSGRGNSQGAHLHFGMKKDGAAINPDGVLGNVSINSKKLDYSKVSDPAKSQINFKISGSFISPIMIDKLVYELKKLNITVKDLQRYTKKQMDFSGYSFKNDEDFYVQVLEGLGVPVTENNLNFLYAWALSENSEATYNPLGTAYSSEKDEGMCYHNCLSETNSITPPLGCRKCPVGHRPGVKNYSTAQYGIESTIQTFKNAIDKYQCIYDGMMNNLEPEELAQCGILQEMGKSDKMVYVLKYYPDELEPTPITT